MSKEKLEIASIPTKNYKEVIEIRVPMRFFWNEDGTFDGVECTFKRELHPWEEDMFMQILDVFEGAMNV